MHKKNIILLIMNKNWIFIGKSHLIGALNDFVEDMAFAGEKSSLSPYLK